MTFYIQHVHKGPFAILLSLSSTDEDRALAEARDYARIAAGKGTPGLYRLWRRNDDGSERYLTSWSVIVDGPFGLKCTPGLLSEHKDVTIPSAHW
jgi:hypothetical protein